MTVPKICLYPVFDTDGVGTYSQALIRHLGLTGVPSRGRPLSLSQFVRGLPRGYDLVHVPHFVVPHRRSDVPCVCTIHDVTPLVLRGAYGRLAVAYLRFRIGWSVRHADHLIFTSENTRKDVDRLFAPSKPYSVIPLGVDPPLSAEPDARSPYEFRYFFCIGRRRPHKNTDLILQAFAQLPARRDVHLVFGGAADVLDGEYRASAHRLGVADRVHFVGALRPEALAAHYRFAVALLFPSLYEGFGLPVLEAMSYGCPVITSRRASLPEVAGDAALFVDPERESELRAAMETLLESEVRRKELHDAGLARADAFTWARTARETREVYDRMLHA